MPSHNPQYWAPSEDNRRDFFRPPIVSTEFLAAFDSVEKVLRERFTSEVSALTREQFIEAMSQAIACGDFMRHLTVGDTSTVDGLITYQHRQGISYLPYREVTALKARIRELEAELAREKDSQMDSDQL